MSYSIVGEQIQKFRKELGLTQKELGESIGVSSSAVSQWESGGTPDISLLPAIADKLHVTIDALFGREGGEVMDIEKIVGNWSKSLKEGRLNQICRMAFEMLKNGGFPSIDLPNLGYMKTCEIGSDIDSEHMILLPSLICDDEGLSIGVFADDLAFSAIFPEPAAGYDAFFSPTESYREFFQMLSESGALKVVLCLASEKWQFFTPGAVAKRAGIPESRTKEVLELLVKYQMAEPLELESEEGEINAYVLRKQTYLVPFLYFARILLDPEGYYINRNVRTTPLLRGKKK
ncbi:MAG: helix-turn-helix transcriptional regulator [Acutalibacter sp.]|nr:helix-turn-helix transcriptional regulator [Acutalibacter sp.]